VPAWMRRYGLEDADQRTVATVATALEEHRYSAGERHIDDTTVAATAEAVHRWERARTERLSLRRKWWPASLKRRH